MLPILSIWNFLVFIKYGMDKLKSVKKLVRIPEWILLTFAFLFGGAGAMFGMVVFNHKTSKIKFRILVPLYVLLNALMLNTSFSAFVTQISSKLV